MLKIILKSEKFLRPFNEKARDLRIQNKPLWLLQRDVFAPYVTQEIELAEDAALPNVQGPCLVYRDNLYFDPLFIKTFINKAKKFDHPSQAAFSIKDPAFREHALPLSISYTQQDDLHLAELWYYPNGPEPSVKPLLMKTKSREIGYYHVPVYMATDQGDLVFQVPLQSLIAIDSWVHIFLADVVYTLFSRGASFENRVNSSPLFKLLLLSKAIYEGKQVLACSELVKIGRNCVIDPSAVIHGPTTIGDNVTIGAGAVIDNCIIGNNVNISQGCQLMLSVVGDGSFLPFRASLFMTTLMDNCMVAQNTCLQMCVVGRNTFIGSGSTFTDFNLIPTPMRAIGGNGELTLANREVLGGCVGHNCRLGAGMIIMPGRVIESDVVLVASNERRVISKNISYEESDHQLFSFAHLHKRLYPRLDEVVEESW